MSSDSGARWWLAINGKSEGPFSSEEIGRRLRSGRVTASTPACAEGLTEWKPIASWPALANAIPAANSSIGPPPPPPPAPPLFPNATPSAPSYSGVSEPVLTNPLLPQMANWICVYGTVVSPALFLVNHMLCFVTGPTASEDENLALVGFLLHVVDALKSCAVTVLLFVGAMRLRRLRASGSALIRIALWIGLVAGVGFLMAELALSVIAESSDSETNQAVLLILFVVLFIDLCDVAFMVTSLIWLTKYEHELPLTPGT